MPFDRSLVENVLLPTVIQFTRTQVVQAEQFLSVYAQHSIGVLRPTPMLAEHPWASVASSLSFSGPGAYCDLLERFVSVDRGLQATRGALAETAGIALTDGIHLSVRGRSRTSRFRRTSPRHQFGLLELPQPLRQSVPTDAVLVPGIREGDAHYQPTAWPSFRWSDPPR